MGGRSGALLGEVGRNALNMVEGMWLWWGLVDMSFDTPWKPTLQWKISILNRGYILNGCVSIVMLVFGGVSLFCSLFLLVVFVILSPPYWVSVKMMLVEHLASQVSFLSFHFRCCYFSRRWNVPNLPMLQCPMHSGNLSFCDIRRSKVEKKIKWIWSVQWKTSQQIWNVHLIQFPLRQTYRRVIFGDMSITCRIDPFAA